MEKNNTTHYNCTIRHIEETDGGNYIIKCENNCWSEGRADIYVNIQLYPSFDSIKTIPELDCKECLLRWRGEHTEVMCLVETKDLHQEFVSVSTVLC